jgi:UDP-N-acetylmuramate dehydrogenase
MLNQQENINLKSLTTFGLSTICSRLIEFSDAETDLPELDRQGLLSDALIMSGGSNLLFVNPTFSHTVIRPTGESIEILDDESSVSNDVRVKVSAATVLDELCNHLATQGLWGTENLSGIPGQIGGAAVQNVGAYGTEFKDVVESVTCYSLKEHKFVTLMASQCNYGYRDSIFKHQPEGETMIVSSVIIRVNKQAKPNLNYKGLKDAVIAHVGDLDTPLEELTPRLIRNIVLALRDSKLPDPLKVGSAGSFFKNPVISSKELADVTSRWEASEAYNANPAPLSYHLQSDGKAKLSAAWLIDKAGCKAFTHGGAAVWQKQPLVLVNPDSKATGQDIVALENMIIERVYNLFGIQLSPEVIHV